MFIIHKIYQSFLDIYGSFFQLKSLSAGEVVLHIKEALPKEWKIENGKATVLWNPGHSGHPEKDWLKNLWDYANLHFRNSLSKLKGLPIIPIRFEEHKVILAYLDKNSKIIYGKSSIPAEIKMTLMDNFDVLFLENLHLDMSHPQLKAYFYEKK